VSHVRSALLAFCIACACLISGARSEEYAETISTQLNATGRVITMSVPLTDDGRSLGEISVQIDPNDAVAIGREPLLQAIGAGINATTRSRIEALHAPNGYLTVAELRDAGVDATFDPASQELKISIAPDDRAVGDIGLGVGQRVQASSQALAPASVSGYVNVVAGVDYAWDSQDSYPNSGVGAHLEIDSGIRAWDTVIENRVLYDGDVDTNLCPVGAVCNFDHTAGVKRQMTRLIRDFPDESIRVSSGDVDPIGTGLQRRANIAGVAIEKAPRILSPLDATAPFASGSLRLERASDVEIRVNGVLLQTLHLRPGVYNWRDLPLSTGANDVEITTIDDLGQRRTQAIRTFYDDSLLAQGTSEWAVVAGVPSYFDDDERRYDFGGYAGTAFLRYGLSDEVTGVLHAQADENVVMAGGGATTRTAWGVFSAEAAGSTGRLGSGVAVNLNWDMINFGGWFAEAGESLRLHSEIRSEGFHTPGEYLIDYDSIIFPEYTYWLRLDASYSLPISNGVTASFSARYQVADPDRFSYSQYVIDDDRYGADVTLSRALSQSSSGSLTLGYSNESYINYQDPDRQSDPEFRFAFHFYWHPDEKTSVAAGYDTLNRQTELSANRQGGEPNATWQTTVNLQQSSFDDRLSATGSLNYQGNRGEIGVMQIAGASSTDGRPFGNGWGDQRTLLRAGTSIAFADGHVAIGRPIRDGAFAIAYPHTSLEGKEVIAGADNNEVGRSDIFGPALITGIPAYVPSSIPISVSDLPIGYSLGSSTIDTFAPYKAGYSYQVGSGNSVSAFGTLMTALGEPNSLQAGTIHPAGKTTPSLEIFTNSAGRFGSEGLAPGAWVIELGEDEEQTHYTFVVPEGTQGLFKAGVLAPVRAP
jgi:outer membrane usher protein